MNFLNEVVVHQQVELLSAASSDTFFSLFCCSYFVFLHFQLVRVYYRMRSLLQNVFSYYSMCSLTTECVLLLQHVFSYYTQDGEAVGSSEPTASHVL